MNKLTTTEWKYFTISRLFTIKPPASRSIKQYNDGDVPYVSSSKVNNGVISYLEPKEDEILEAGKCITVNPLDGTAFYQEDDFLGRGGAGSAISLLYNEEMSKYSALFICTVIKTTARQFDYSDAFTSDNLLNFSIPLPVQHTNDGNITIDDSHKYSDNGFVPDWKYMESYMEQIEETSQRRIDMFKSLVSL